MTVVLLALRGVAAIVVLTVLVGGMPRIASAALAVALGLWSAVLVAPAHALDASVAMAIGEVAIGASLGVVGAVPLLAASAAGRLVDLASADRAQGPYTQLFGLLAAAVFVGIDGHVAVLTAIVDSHAAVPAVAQVRPGVVAAIGYLIPSAIRLALPWLVTAAIVQLAVGIGTRVAARSGPHVHGEAAIPAALAMMTASLIATLALAIAAIVRGAL